MATVTVEEAQAHLAKLIDKLPAAEGIIITRHAHAKTTRPAGAIRAWAQYGLALGPHAHAPSCF